MWIVVALSSLQKASQLKQSSLLCQSDFLAIVKADQGHVALTVLSIDL
jgi:hypothetical protein